MSLRSVAKLGLMVALLLPTAVTLSACGGGQQAKHADIKPAEMPVGGAWTGVYYSPLYGYLHLIQDGDSATGAWRTAAGDAWGELSGKVDGNVLKYEWTEHKIGMVGATANRTGKGFFRYLAPTEGEAHELQGEWGLGEDQAGNDWKAVKQMNMQPNPKSVRPDEIEGRTGGGGWDDDEGGGDEGGGDEGLGIDADD